MSDKIQSTTVAQPVAWRYRHRGDPWSVCDTKPEEHVPGMLEVQPLYAAQPPAAPVETKPKASGNINCNRCGGTDPGCYICRDYPHHSSAGSVPTNRQLHDAIATALNQEGLTYSGIQQAVFAVQDLYGAAPQAAPVIVGYQRRNIGPDGTPWSSWYPANDEPTPENMKFDGYLSYEYRPVHAGSPLPRPQLERPNAAPDASTPSQRPRE